MQKYFEKKNMTR